MGWVGLGFVFVFRAVGVEIGRGLVALQESIGGFFRGKIGDRKTLQTARDL